MLKEAGDKYLANTVCKIYMIVERRVSYLMYILTIKKMVLDFIFRQSNCWFTLVRLIGKLDC